MRTGVTRGQVLRHGLPAEDGTNLDVLMAHQPTNTAGYLKYCDIFFLFLCVTDTHPF